MITPYLAFFRAGSSTPIRLGRKKHAYSPIRSYKPQPLLLGAALSIRTRDNGGQLQRCRLKLPSMRQYHSTAKREILPLVAAGFVFFIGRYSWKALNRMDLEWEDYLWELKLHERHRLDTVADSTVTIGIDLGTFYSKISLVNKNKPELIETVQGDRYRFNGILQQDNGDVVMGQTALESFYYNRCGTKNNRNTVILPYLELQQQAQADAETLLQKVFAPTVSDALERVISGERSSFQGEEKRLRTVITLPPKFYNDRRDALFRQNYHDDTHHTITVPEPVAAIWGAHALNLISAPKSKEENKLTSTVVVDIGGLTSIVSLVRDDKVVASISLDGIGGESMVQRLVERILADSGDETMGKDPKSLIMIHSSARSSVLEMVNKAQSKIHIPFLLMGRKPDNPHFDTTISRAMLEQDVQDSWISQIVPKLLREKKISASLPTPNNITSLFTSSVTKIFEESNEIPTNIKQVLLVGGGSRHIMFEKAFKESIIALMGPVNFQKKTVIPESSTRAELTALGASSLLPNFDYGFDHGLERL